MPNEILRDLLGCTGDSLFYFLFTVVIHVFCAYSAEAALGVKLVSIRPVSLPTTDGFVVAATLLGIFLYLLDAGERALAVAASYESYLCVSVANILKTVPQINHR